MEKQEIITRNGIALGQAETLMAPVVAAHSPWKVAIVTSIVGATTGWLIEEVTRRRRRR